MAAQMTRAKADDPLQMLVVSPPEGVAERLRAALAPIRQVPGFVSAVVTRRDGLVIHHTFKTARDAAGLSAMAAAMIGAARSTGLELRKGLPEYGFFRFQEGVLLIRDAGPAALLACLLETDANIGYAIAKLTRVSQLVQETLEEL
ncbi:MAG TPA: roadblock/LC7 domain-containing protein [Thermoplasmata archaeon]